MTYIIQTRNAAQVPIEYPVHCSLASTGPCKRQAKVALFRCNRKPLGQPFIFESRRK